MPIAPLIWIVIALLRATGVVKSGGGTQRAARMGFGVVFVRIIFMSTVFSMFETAAEPTKSIALWSGATLCAPGLLLHFIVVPLGLWRLAYWMTICLRPLGAGIDAKATAACHAARALGRKRRVQPAQIAWIERRLALATRGRGATTVAAGLLCALRGDLRGARSLFSAADELHPRFLSRSLRRVARDWLVADAAASGDWAEVVRRGARRERKLRWSYAVGRMAERLARTSGAPYAFTLVVLWLVAPRRFATWLLLLRSLRTTRTATDRARPADSRPNLPEALARIASLLRKPVPPSIQAVEETARALEAALELPGTRAHLERRALGLDARTTADAVLSGLRERLEGMIATLVSRVDRSCPWDTSLPLLDGATTRARRRMVEEIELVCDDYKRRTEDHLALSEIDEWRAWASLLDNGERLLGLDASAQPMLFDLAFVPVCNFAVFQHNHHRRTALAHQMYSWLHAQADGNDSLQASVLLSKNMAAALD